MKNTDILQKHTYFGWMMFLLSAVFYAIDYFQHTAPSVLLLPMAKSLNLSITTIGNIMSIYFPFYALSQIPAGYLIDRFSLSKVLGCACFVTSLGVLIMSINLQSTLLTGRIMVAIGSSCAFIGALKTASAWLPKVFFPIAVGLTNTLGVVGGLFGQPVLQALINLWSWQKALILIAFFGFFWTILLFVFLHNKKSPSTTLIFNEHLFKNINLYIMALYAGMMVGIIVNAFSELYDVVFLHHVFHISEQVASIISSALFIGIAIGGPTHGILAKKIGEKKWMIYGYFLSMTFFATIIVMRDIISKPLILFILYFLTGFFVSSMLLIFDVVRKLFPNYQHATAFAIINMIIGLCGFFAQYTIGHLIQLIKILFPGNQNMIFSISFTVFFIPLLFAFVFLLWGVPNSFLKTTTT